MSLVDRWLARPFASVEAATFATSATPLQEASIPAGFDVASPLRHSAKTKPAATTSPIVSHPVATGLRQEKPQNSAAVGAMSQMSQRAESATWGEAGEERAAIVEHDANIPREWAEGFARLDPDRPPGDVPLKRWQRFVDDVGLFLDSPFCSVAAALGWGPHDLFGCDRDRPFARLDQCGLLWLLNGNKLIALSENTATIEMPTGARQTWRRQPTEPGRALVWELTP